MKKMNAVLNEDGEQQAQQAAPKAPKAKAVVETVTMTDGRQVEFAGKRKLVKDYVVGDDGQLSHIQLDFRNGETRQIVIPAQLIGQFAGHGALQKYGDETAGEDDVDDMVLAIDDLDARIQKGEWSVAREGGGMSGTSVLIKALMEYGNRSVEQVKAFLTGKSQGDKQALRNNDKRPNAQGQTVKSIVQRLESEKASKATKVDTDAMLEGL
jgi:hypothetical protein